MLTIIFESHGTTLDNEAGLSSGIFDVQLSELGKRQARELGDRYRTTDLAAVYCSDLQRSYKTAEIAFKGKSIPIIHDARLRECDYGTFTRRSVKEVEALRGAHVHNPFPNGESYEQTTARMKDFLRDALRAYDGKTVMIIGHRATQYGLEHWIRQVPLEEAVIASWKWQPGWTYQLEEI